MSEQMVDVAIVGGGLSGGLIALALSKARPELRLALIESGASLGGNHRWSWFASDLSREGQALMSTFRLASWEGGYAVYFPQYSRALSTPYRSLASHDFAAGLSRVLGQKVVRLQSPADRLDAKGVTLAGGERIGARTVIDCRTFAPTDHLEGGWQIFLGRRTQLERAHSLKGPIVMDATAHQIAPHGKGGAYRFFYVLPLGAHDVFVEDTYYADAPRFDRSALSARIEAFHQHAGWEGQITDNESGILPVITGGNFAAYQDSMRIAGVTIAGARGGFTHPLTSYSVPMAVDNALAIAREADLTGYQLASFIEARARQHWSRTGFYRRLGRMLFLAAKPEQRVRVFAQFYRRPQPLIERFYAARSSFADRCRILSGAPPVSLSSALTALAGHCPPLKMDTTP